jgi:hypothetical protein
MNCRSTGLGEFRGELFELRRRYHLFASFTYISITKACHALPLISGAMLHIFKIPFNTLLGDCSAYFSQLKRLIIIHDPFVTVHFVRQKIRLFFTDNFNHDFLAFFIEFAFLRSKKVSIDTCFLVNSIFCR